MQPRDRVGLSSLFVSMQVKSFNINHTYDQNNHEPMIAEDKIEKYYAKEKLWRPIFFI
jgi:hypothetical protein